METCKKAIDTCKDCLGCVHSMTAWNSPGEFYEKVFDFVEIAAAAGFAAGADGKLNLPATQETADKLEAAAVAMLPEFNPTAPAAPIDGILTGAGPVWGHLAVAHALHGRIRSLRFVAPNAPNGIVVFSHGA